MGDERTADMQITEMEGLRKRVRELGKIQLEYERTSKLLQEREDLLRLITQNMSDMIRLTDMQGINRYVSPSHRTFLGYSPEERIGRYGAEFIHPDDLDRVMKAYADALVTGKKPEKMQYRFRHADGHYVWLETDSDFIYDDSGGLKGGVFNSEDVTNRRRMEESLREREELYKAIAERPFAGVYVIQKGRFRFASAYTASFVGYSVDEMIGRESLPVIHQDDRTRVGDLARKMLRGEREDPYEFRVVTRDGQVRWVIETVTPIKYEGQRAVLGSAMDITDRKKMEAELGDYKENLEKLVEKRTGELKSANRKLQMEIAEHRRTEEELRKSREQLRSLAARLESLREEERTSLSREIHDEFGQSLTGMKMELAWLVRHLPGDEELIVKKARAMLKLVDDNIKLIRNISTKLRPGILDDFGLLAAMEWQTREFDERTGIRCRFHSSAGGRINIDKSSSSSLFRIFQEALTNIARHSKATKVRIKLDRGSNRLFMEIHDNGIGFHADGFQANSSLGILGMKERVALMNGEFEIQSDPGKGTAVRVSIPCLP